MSSVEIAIRLLVFTVGSMIIYRRLRIHRHRPEPSSTQERRVYRAERLEVRGIQAAAICALVVGLFPDLFGAWLIYLVGFAAALALGAIMIGSFLRHYWDS